MGSGIAAGEPITLDSELIASASDDRTYVSALRSSVHEANLEASTCNHPASALTSPQELARFNLDVWTGSSFAK